MNDSQQSADQHIEVLVSNFQQSLDRPEPRYHENAITELTIQLQYSKHPDSPPENAPLVKQTKRRFSGLLLPEEVPAWVSPMFTSQIEKITVTAIKVYHGGEKTPCEISVR
jgi:hypothetical protein